MRPPSSAAAVATTPPQAPGQHGHGHSHSSWASHSHSYGAHGAHTTHTTHTHTHTHSNPRRLGSLNHGHGHSHTHAPPHAHAHAPSLAHLHTPTGAGAATKSRHGSRPASAAVRRKVEMIRAVLVSKVEQESLRRAQRAASDAEVLGNIQLARAVIRLRAPQDHHRHQTATQRRIELVRVYLAVKQINALR